MKQKIYIIGTPAYNNLGDHAIAYAQKLILNKYFPTHDIVEVTSYEFEEKFSTLKTEIKPEDIITIIGGGNMGNQYLKEENARQTIIKTFKDNIIISFPQTLYFIDSKDKDKEVATFKEVYSSHKNLHVFLREHKSYDAFKKLVPTCKAYLCPDIVISLPPVLNGIRQGVILSLREDSEKVLSIESKDYLTNLALNVSPKVNYIDTVNKWWEPKNREDFLTEFMATYSKANLIITDRLHGMILASITRTPCVVLPSLNHKIIASFDYLKHLKFIQFASSLEDVESKIKVVLENINTTQDDSKILDSYFEPLTSLLSNINKQIKKD